MTIKLNIKKDNEDLKIHFFVVQRGSVLVVPNAPEDIKVALSYNEREAIDIIRHEYSVGTPLVIRQRAKIEIRKLLDVLNLPAGEAVRPVKETKEEEFVNGMLLVADKFVKDKRDQASIKRIIKKISK